VHRSRLAVAAIIAVGVLASACGGSSSGGSGSGPNAVANEITIWDSNIVWFPWQNAHLAAFTRATGIKVNVNPVPVASILDKELIAQRAHSGAFAMYEGPTSLISQDIGVGGGVPLKPLINNSQLTSKSFNLNDFTELGDCTLNGTLYCLPTFIDGAVLAYNPKLFSEAGISSPPQTWSDVLTDANAITTKTGTPGFCTRGSQAGAAVATFHFGLAYFIPYSPQNKGFMVGPHWKSLLDSPGAVQWATEFQALMTKDAPKGVGSYAETDCLAAFDQGKVAMDWEGITSFTGNELNPPANSPLHNNVSFTALKCPSSSPCMPLGPWGMFINPHATKAQQNAVWKLMQFLVSPSYITQSINATHFPGLAVLKSVSSQTFAGVPSSYQSAAIYVAAHAEPAPFPPTTVFNQSQQDEEIAISQLIAGTKPAQAMQFAAQGQNTVFQQAGLH
jgi:ABC-type glycerol-3-phosphate transport system substrate-binding protein